MTRWLLIFVIILSFTVAVYAEDLTIDLRYEPTATTEPSQSVLATVKLLRPVRIDRFTDKRTVAANYLGDLKLNGQVRKVLSNTELAIFATEVFRKVYGEWGGKVASENMLQLKGEVTQFKIEESDGYQTRISLHFYLHDDSGKVLWDGHTSGVVKGAGKSLRQENLSMTISDILRATYAEMLEDDKLVGVWSGNVSNTYIIRDELTSTAVQKSELK